MNASFDDLSANRDNGESVQQLLPPVLVIIDRVIGQPAVDESHERFVAVGNQSDCDLS